MNIVVDKLPCSCDECMFAGVALLNGYCSLTKWLIEKYDENGEPVAHREEHCPLVEFETLLNNTVY